MLKIPPRSQAARWVRDPRLTWVGGAVLSLGIGILLISRYSLGGTLSRDEGIYLYGGQQLARHGVAPYASIFDPKGPLADMLAALGIAIGHVFGLKDVIGARLLFLVLSLGTVLALYLLARRVFSSVLAGVVAAAVLSSFNGFANDAIQGPDAKTPGIFCAVLAMWLATHRRWFWVGVLSSLAFLTWQPMVLYAVVFAPCALLLPTGEPGRVHWRPLGRLAAGFAAPLVATAIYFLADGTWHEMWTSAFVFPLTGIKRARQSFAEHVQLIIKVINTNFYHSATLLYVGAILLVVVAAAAFVRHGRNWRAALADPVVCICFSTGVLNVAYALYDFQGYPDVLPLLPYGALGFAGAAALVAHQLRNRPAHIGAEVVVAGLVVALVALTVGWFGQDPRNDHGLRGELANACAIQRSLAGTHERLWSLGYPPALVLTERTNPQRYIYLESGVARWKVRHTAGGLRGWTREIMHVHPGVVVNFGWKNSLKPRIAHFLRHHGYHSVHFGTWTTFLDPAARAQAAVHGVRLSKKKTNAAHSVYGTELPGYRCLPSGG